MTGKSSKGGAFPLTRWSMVAAAASTGSDSASALEQLCRLYWPPLYAFARYRGYPVTEAEDLVQSFLLHLVETQTVGEADQHKGRFRSFLIGCFKHHLSDRLTHERAQKRGGLGRAISLDTSDIEDSLLHDSQPTPELQIERLVDRQWALVVMQQALQALEAQHVGPRRATFDVLRPCWVLPYFHGRLG
jgi:RNA polymerase sigma factor (sigma-70 family)